MNNNSEFLAVFYQAFGGIFDLFMDTPLHFPEPIGDITIFEFSAFFLIAELLSNMAMNIATRRGDHDDY